MRIIHTDIIKREAERLIYDCSFFVPPEIREIYSMMLTEEDAPLARQSLSIILENGEIASREEIPLCQDCGSVIFFLEIGQDVHIEGSSLYDALNEAVACAYQKHYLRKSIVSDPLRRVNTGTNTPSFIHIDIVDGDKISLHVLLKGGGSENASALRMFRPTDSIDSIISFIEEVIVKAGPNPCPPIFLGIGIGGTADVAMVNSKKALLRPIDAPHCDPFYAELEERIKVTLNKTGVGPLGFGGKNTVAAVFIKEAPTHIASLPVALNLNCHSFRKGGIVI